MTQTVFQHSDGEERPEPLAASGSAAPALRPVRSWRPWLVGGLSVVIALLGGLALYTAIWLFQPVSWFSASVSSPVTSPALESLPAPAPASAAALAEDPAPGTMPRSSEDTRPAAEVSVVTAAEPRDAVSAVVGADTAEGTPHESHSEATSSAVSSSSSTDGMPHSPALPNPSPVTAPPIPGSGTVSSSADPTPTVSLIAEPPAQHPTDAHQDRVIAPPAQVVTPAPVPTVPPPATAPPEQRAMPSETGLRGATQQPEDKKVVDSNREQPIPPFTKDSPVLIEKRSPPQTPTNTAVVQPPPTTTHQASCQKATVRAQQRYARGDWSRQQADDHIRQNCH